MWQNKYEEEVMVVKMYRKLHKEDREDINNLEEANFELRCTIAKLKRKIEDLT